MKIATSFTAALLLVGSLGTSSAFAAAEGVISNATLSPAFDMVSRPELSMRRITLVIFLLITMVSGCSVLADSRNFYRDLPPRPINWREYTSD